MEAAQAGFHFLPALWVKRQSIIGRATRVGRTFDNTVAGGAGRAVGKNCAFHSKATTVRTI